MMIKILRIFSLMYFIMASAYAGVLDHTKIIHSKPPGHCLPGIDYIYMINLDHRPEKFQACADELKPYGIHPYRFSAVNGWELTSDQINDVGVKFTRGMRGGFMATSYDDETEGHFHEMIHQEGRVYFCHCMSRGAIGIILSHLSIIKDAYESGYNTIWVMEDDIEVRDDPFLVLDRIEELDRVAGEDGWDILFTDLDTRDRYGNYVPARGYLKRPNYTPRNINLFYLNASVSPNLRRIGTRFGAYSMIIRRSGMKKILDFYKRYNAFFPYDFDYVAANGFRAYTVKKDIISSRIDALSDNSSPGN